MVAANYPFHLADFRYDRLSHNDRRIATRHNLSVRVTAVVTQTTGEDHHKRICSLDLLNLSTSGLAAVADQPMPAGTRVAVFFPPHGPEQGFDLFGTIVRCQDSTPPTTPTTPDHPHRHILGVRLDQRRAA